MQSTLAGLAAVVVFAIGSVAQGAAEDVAARQISIDATVTVGALRPLNGVQAQDAQGAAFYRTAHVDLVRIPDATGAGDIDAIFPDMSADAENPKSYNFAPTDRLVESIRSGGAEPLFRIGRSAGAGSEPPADVDKWAQIVRHVVLHYNAKWAKGISLRHSLLGGLEPARLEAILERHCGRILSLVRQDRAGDSSGRSQGAGRRSWDFQAIDRGRLSRKIHRLRALKRPAVGFLLLAFLRGGLERSLCLRDDRPATAHHPRCARLRVRQERLGRMECGSCR